jgi:REP-associated tyrosine transposase
MNKRKTKIVYKQQKPKHQSAPPFKKYKNIRLPHYDYRQQGAYFVTVCARNKLCLFGKIIENRMHQNLLGDIVEKTWLQIPLHAPYVYLSEYVVMPNHFHGLLNIQYSCNAIHPENYTAKKILPKSLGALIRSFKSATTKEINELGLNPFISDNISQNINNVSGKRQSSIWQPRYYEHVVRNDEELYFIKQYINENPLRWHLDSLYEAL